MGMRLPYGAYETIIGLEVHVELKTATKIFCGCSTAFGAEPNTQVCPVCTGQPGSLPVLNKKVVEYAVKAGLATGCRIAPRSGQDRKNYFYPDLPKGYQISQYDLPLCQEGRLDIETDRGTRQVGIIRIHIEEDAGKLIHLPQGDTKIDCNRCGVPLIEIVSAPDMRSAEEAKAYLQKLRAIIAYTGISDCKMNEGSLRCDVNLSVRKKGEAAFGTRTEMKNLNSFAFVGKAIEYEAARQIELLESGGRVVQETRRFDPATGKTDPLRRKENADDYRYFPDPDLAPVVVDRQVIEALAAQIPALPDARKKEYTARFGLSPYCAEQVSSLRKTADYFEQAAPQTAFPVLAANLLLAELPRLLPGEDGAFALSPLRLAQVAQLQGEGVIGSNTCKELISLLLVNDEDPRALVKQRNMTQISDGQTLRTLARVVISEQEKTARDYLAGKTAALQALVGQMMKKTGGTCDPRKAREILAQLLGEMGNAPSRPGQG